MNDFLRVFIKDILSYLSISIVVLLLFVVYYFTIPSYWFLCSLVTIFIAAIFDIFVLSKKKNKS